MPDTREGAPPPARDPPAEPPTILLVDGDEAVRDAVANALCAAGFRAATFDSAEQFLDVYRPGRPACLVIELDLPGMDGIELLRTLGDRKRALPAIITSRRLRRRALASLLAPLCALLLEKPFGVDDLLPLIEQALAIAPARSRP